MSSERAGNERTKSLRATITRYRKHIVLEGCIQNGGDCCRCKSAHLSVHCCIVIQEEFRILNLLVVCKRQARRSHPSGSIQIRLSEKPLKAAIAEDSALVPCPGKAKMPENPYLDWIRKVTGLQKKTKMRQHVYICFHDPLDVCNSRKSSFESAWRHTRSNHRQLSSFQADKSSSRMSYIELPYNHPRSSKS